MQHRGYSKILINGMLSQERRQRQTYASQQSERNTSAKHRENIITSTTSQRDEPSS